MISRSACLPRSSTDQIGPPLSARPTVSYTTLLDTIGADIGIQSTERLPTAPTSIGMQTWRARVSIFSTERAVGLAATSDNWRRNFALQLSFKIKSRGRNGVSRSATHRSCRISRNGSAHTGVCRSQRHIRTTSRSTAQWHLSLRKDSACSSGPSGLDDTGNCSPSDISQRVRLSGPALRGQAAPRRRTLNVDERQILADVELSQVTCSITCARGSPPTAPWRQSGEPSRLADP